jgi:hypothetical protein
MYSNVTLVLFEACVIDDHEAYLFIVSLITKIFKFNGFSWWANLNQMN